MTTLELFEGFLGNDSRLRLFTRENWTSIPEDSGYYAWYLPLWILNHDLNSLMHGISRLLHFDPQNTNHINLSFLRDTIKMDITKTVNTNVSDYKNSKELWESMMKDNDFKDEIQKLLLEVSLFMPPLYIGETGNLKRRYIDHTSGKAKGNTFHRRFHHYIQNEWPESNFEPIEVADLLFLCIKPSFSKTFTSFRADNIRKLMEHVLIRLCKPAFNIKGQSHGNS